MKRGLVKRLVRREYSTVERGKTIKDSRTRLDEVRPKTRLDEAAGAKKRAARAGSRAFPAPPRVYSISLTFTYTFTACFSSVSWRIISE